MEDIIKKLLVAKIPFKLKGGELQIKRTEESTDILWTLAPKLTTFRNWSDNLTDNVWYKLSV